MPNKRKKFFDLSNRQKLRIINLELTDTPHISSTCISSENSPSIQILQNKNQEAHSSSHNDVLKCEVSNSFSSNFSDAEDEAEDDCNFLADSDLFEFPDEQNENSKPNISNTNITSFTNELRKWTVKYNIQKSALSDLLKLLKEHHDINLPADARTLMKTPVKTISKLDLGNGGQSMYFGIEEGVIRTLKKFYVKSPDLIKLDFNIDGLPLHKSSSSQFWPILCSFSDENIYTEPFIVKIFYGAKKPNDVNVFLKDFVIDLKNISERGIIYCGKNIDIIVHAFICDTPAKSFILGIKNHTGYFGCNKCIQEGEFIQNRLVFPELNSTLRSDLSFRNRTQPEHHLVSSELENLNIDMISQFPLDYMHLICLGVMKKILTFWIRGTLDVRIKKNIIPEMVEKSISLKVPKEFCRSPRSILEFDRWKATEFRQFLLYTGMYILKDAVNKMLFEHFLCLSIAVRILSDKEHCQNLFYYAKQLLHYFVKKFECYYGRHFMSYNVHNLLHLCDDVQKFGTLDMFSAFKYENHLFKLKLKLKDTSRPLCQIVNRITEENLLLLHSPQNVSYPYVKFKNGDAMSVIFNTFCISLSEFNNLCLLENNIIFAVNEILIVSENIFLKGKQYLSKRSYFHSPCDSSQFDIYIISNNVTTEFLTYPVQKVKRKLLSIPLKENELLVVPLVL